MLICLYAVVRLGVRERHSKERRDAVMRFSLQKWHSGIVSQCCTCPYAVCVSDCIPSGCIPIGRISIGCVTGKREPRVHSRRTAFHQHCESSQHGVSSQCVQYVQSAHFHDVIKGKCRGIRAPSHGCPHCPRISPTGEMSFSLASFHCKRAAL